MSISIPGLLPEYISFIVAFVFVFAIVYALLSYSKVFGKLRMPLATIAIVIAFVSATYEPLVTTLQTFLPIATGILIVLFFIVFIKKLFEGKKDSDPWPAAIGLACFLIVLGALWQDIMNYLGVINPIISPEIIGFIVAVIAILLIFIAAYKTGDIKTDVISGPPG